MPLLSCSLYYSKPNRRPTLQHYRLLVSRPPKLFRRSTNQTSSSQIATLNRRSRSKQVNKVDIMYVQAWYTITYIHVSTGLLYHYIYTCMYRPAIPLHIHMYVQACYTITYIHVCAGLLYHYIYTCMCRPAIPLHIYMYVQACYTITYIHVCTGLLYHYIYTCMYRPAIPLHIYMYVQACNTITYIHVYSRKWLHASRRWKCYGQAGAQSFDNL